MSPVQAVRTVLSKYAVFSGRARRSEYWWFFLFNAVLSTVAITLDAALFDTGQAATTASSAAFSANPGPISVVIGLALLLPGLGVAVRRLHDTDRRGWWIFIGLVPLVGPIVLIVFYVLDSTIGENRFGPNPKSVGAGDQVTA
ncbi:DUF805 domain-containing protein [Jannaschia sp. R86511]|uniref:DUF805 domain-containing protein n=1 Tax=Jannaschia sp. R86511 TaxID=3093853 RepID=UPI0036D30A12